jgi:4-hydroxybenzoate polyprenyltransferase
MIEASQARIAAGPADAPAQNWVDRFAPLRMRPYLRLMRADRPIGTWLLLIPCLQGLALGLASMEPDGAGEWSRAALYAGLFSVGAFAMRGAGCAYNDIVDRDIDAKVARTAGRPLASGQVSLKAAWALLIGLSLIGLAVLLQFNRFAIGLGLASLALVAAYPFMKRITWWPQAWLGLTFNWGALMGYAALHGRLDPAALSLYGAGILWTLGYDTIYAHQDREDDALIGVKSSARRLGAATRPALYLFYGGAIAALALAGHLARLHPFYFAALAPAALHLYLQVRRVDLDDPASCLRQFRANRDAGLLVLAALLSGAAL